jgi:hypothetical protein
MTTLEQREKRFDWPLCYEAEENVLRLIDAFVERNGFARELRERMARETGTLLIDWIDHLAVAKTELSKIQKLGYCEEPFTEPAANQTVFWHPEAMLPRIVVDASLAAAECPARMALKVDSIADFMLAHRLSGEPEGAPLSRFRRLVVAQENQTQLEVIERRGYRGLLPSNPDPSKYLKAQELWKTRPRFFDSDEEGFARAHEMLDRVVHLVGKDLACHIVFEQERAYWQSRNRAGQVQKARQDKLGLGWANHDHHTFRCSRRHFLDLMRALEKLGFERRERYYAGSQAGWGAQILEQPVEGIVTFCDVDLQTDETDIDFSRQPLPPSSKLGTIGLWVGLHGESFLEAGMHHLECRFDYESLRDQLAEQNVGTMKPFSDFPFLKQAFTDGERWPVRRERAERLLRQGLIDEQQFQQFLRDGAIGSHLENLQRKGGFKGFNQKSVSVIIEATDPRLQSPRAA